MPGGRPGFLHVCDPGIVSSSGRNLLEHIGAQMSAQTEIVNPPRVRKLPDPPRDSGASPPNLAAYAGPGILTCCGGVFENARRVVGLVFLRFAGVTLLSGFWQAASGALVAVACLCGYLTLPLHGYHITGMPNVVLFAGLAMPALVTRRLSVQELLNARETAVYRTRMEQLYELVRDSILFDLSQAPGPQLIVSIHRAFATRAVALFDANLGRLDRVGNWGQNQEELAKECYMHGAPRDDSGTDLSQRVLRVGTKPIGALLLCGDLSPLVVDTLASLAVITMERCQSEELRCGDEPTRQIEPLRSVLAGKKGAETSRHALIRCGEIELDPGKRRALKGGHEIHLTPKEFDMLHCLMRNIGKPIPYEQLLETVWGPEHGTAIQTLRTFARQLRKKIEDDPANPKCLEVVTSIGYRFIEPDRTV